jgi:hypothetical protein
MIEFFKNQNVYVEQNPEFIIIFFFIIGLLLFFSKKIFQKLITGVKDFSDPFEVSSETDRIPKNFTLFFGCKL